MLACRWVSMQHSALQGNWQPLLREEGVVSAPWRLLIYCGVHVDCAGTGQLLQIRKNVHHTKHTTAPPDSRCHSPAVPRPPLGCRLCTAKQLHARHTVHNVQIYVMESSISMRAIRQQHLSTCPVHATLQQVPAVHITHEIALNQQLLHPLPTQHSCRCNSSCCCR